jgi:NADH-quinone oxidoreductase subunit N
VLPKIAGAVALVRLLAVALPMFAPFAWQMVLVISILTMTVGNVCALWQTNVRRMMAYSSIAHAGYLLIGLSVALGRSSFLSGSEASYGGLASLLFYLIVYTFGTLGTFAVLAHLSSDEREVSTLDELAGLNSSKPIAAGLLAIFMFSQAGIPPLAGFWGKLTLFQSAVRMVTEAGSAPYGLWFAVLAVAGALNAAIAAAYYLRVVGAVYFRANSTPLARRGNSGALAAAVICGVVVVLIGISPGRALSNARLAEQALAPASVTQSLAP